ncbi:protein eva-1 homolog C isoform X2 [Stegastes partitus]|uniref:Protein eva-1 homolog C isoform X2 n=1 Tax=Stegastes partitus TaxID=144197 RepID=A0A9Y4JSH7_9TELE|nr:PREDICTED: protein eva-1 homolog C isoform X2 [Stegastes partitus]
MRVMSWTRPCHGLDWSHSLICLTLLLWTRRMNGLADFSNYLSRIITSHSAHACDGQPLRLHCPRHSTISVQSAFYGSGEVRLCRADPDLPLRGHNHSCSAFTALQKLLSECQSHRDCQLPVNHLLFGKDPCPGTAKYLHVHYKCKPTEHKRHVVCEGETMVLRCKPPRVLNIYAAVYGRSLGQTDTCPSHLTRPPPFECLNHEAVHLVSKSCYNKQKCAVAVSNQTFRDPCFPGTRKYLSVIYSCATQRLFCLLSNSTTDFTEGSRPEHIQLHLISHRGYRESLYCTSGGAFFHKSARQLRSYDEQLSPDLCLHQRAPRNGSATVYLQRVRWSSHHAAGRVCPSDLQRAAAQRSKTRTQVC